MKSGVLGLGLVALAAFAVPASAHHSFAMFDSDKTITMTGVVKELEWSNPHVWLRLMVDDQAGPARQWALEMGAPAQQSRIGWKPDSVKPGDKITVTMHPLKDGARGGQFVSAVLPNGQTLGDGGRRPNAQGG
jgi:Family of unknown function (DUF6152)